MTVLNWLDPLFFGVRSIRSGGVELPERPTLNFIGFTATDNAAENRIDVTYGGSVPAARQVIGGAGLTGGGDLSADRTLAVGALDGSIVVGADGIRVGEISDIQHGERSGGALHALATVDAPGFMHENDKKKLDEATSDPTADTLVMRGLNGEVWGARLRATPGGLAPEGEGDISVDADGRPQVYVGGTVRSVALTTDPRWSVTDIKTADYTAQVGELVRVSGQDPVTVTLPTAVGNAGREVAVKESAGESEIVTVAAPVGQTVDGAAEELFAGGYGYRVYASDGANWLRIS